MFTDTKLAPPWVLTYNRILALLDGDPSYQISELGDDHNVTITTDNRMKYMLLEKNLNFELFKAMDLNVELKFIGKSDVMEANELAAMLESNPHFDTLFEVKDGPFPYSAVIFKNEVIQYQNDNLFDPWGHASTIAEELVPFVFKNKPFCSTSPD